MTTHECVECFEPWESISAANECAILDVAEAKEARRPVRLSLRSDLIAIED